MTPHIAFVLGLAVLVLVLFSLDRLRLDQVAIAVPVVLLVSGILSPAEALAGLSSEATITVAAMLVLGLGLQKTGVVAAIGSWAGGANLGGPTMRLLVLSLIVAGLSPFLNNTAVVTVFIPVFAKMAENAGEPPSRYLMPLSFVAMLGGTVTLMGTSTNLVVHGEAVARGLDDLAMFSIAPLGLICLGVGIIYLFVLGKWLIPRRTKPPDLTSRYGVRHFVTELSVGPRSSVVGRSLSQLRWGERYGVSVLGIERGPHGITAPRGESVIEEGDLLSVQGDAKRLLTMARREGLGTPRESTAEGGAGLTAETSGEGRLVEVIVAPGSPFLSRTLKGMNFAQRYDAIVMAIQRHGVNLPGRLAEVGLEVGDILLLHGEPHALHRLADEPGLVPMGEVATPFRGRPRAWVAAAILGGVVAAAATGLTGITTAAITGVVAMIFTGCVRVEEMYAELDWLVVFVLAGLIPLGIALESTGAASWIAEGVVDATGGLGEMGLVAAFYLVTAVMTAVVSNAATAVVLTPVAILAAQGAGINPYALLVTVMFAASASFVTPFGYQTNVMIYSPGGYRFGDFVRVGTPLSLILLLVTVIFVPMFW